MNTAHISLVGNLGQKHVQYKINV